MNQTQSDNRISYLRAIACIAIVFLHVFQYSDLAYGENLNINFRLISMIVIQLLFWAVPTFLMISGSLHLSQDRSFSYKKLFNKYIRKVLISLIVFSFIYQIIDLFLAQQVINVSLITNTLLNIFTGTGWGHLWYLYLLIGLYLMLPIFRLIVKSSEKFDLKYFLTIMLIFLSVLPLTQYFNLNSAFFIPVFSIYPLYFFLGYAIDNNVYKLELNLARIIFWLSTTIIGIVAYFKWRYDLTFFNGLLGYASILVIIQAASLYNIFKFWSKPADSSFKKILLAIDKNSFGIYMIHLIVIQIMIYQFHFNPYELFGFVGILLFGFLTLGLSYVITGIVGKIPYINKII